MVNKLVLVFVVVIGLTAMAVGAFVGMQLGGPTAAGPTATPAGAGGSATPTPAASPANGTATATTTSMATTTPTARVDIDAPAVERAVATAVNDRRNDRGIGALIVRPKITEMARFHSDNMATQGYLSHAATGYTTAARYEEYDLADRCRIADDSNTGIREDQELEVLALVTVGPNGTNATQLAASAVESWFAEQESRQRLTYRNADQVGIGVTVTDGGRVFITVNLC